MRRLDFIAELGTASERNQMNAPRASIVVTNRLHLVDGDGREIDLLPPPEVKFDDGDVVPILLRRGRYENTVTSGNALRGPRCPPVACVSARP
jgi:hypothetical protein